MKNQRTTRIVYCRRMDFGSYLVKYIDPDVSINYRLDSYLVKNPDGTETLYRHTSQLNGLIGLNRGTEVDIYRPAIQNAIPDALSICQVRQYKFRVLS